MGRGWSEERVWSEGWKVGVRGRGGVRDRVRGME